MKIKNKYIRNKSFRNKHWNAIKSRSHPYETHMIGDWYGNVESQIKRHFEWIEIQVLALEGGHHGTVFMHAPAKFRRYLNKSKKSRVRAALQKINAGFYDEEIPIFKKDADWEWF
jgi:hypothetical protein